MKGGRKGERNENKNRRRKWGGRDRRRERGRRGRKMEEGKDERKGEYNEKANF